MQLYILVSTPLVLLDGVGLALFELALFNVFKAAKRVYRVCLDRNGRKERFLLEHRALVHNVLINILQAVVAHASQ